MESKLELAKKAVRTFKTKGMKATLQKTWSYMFKRRESIALQNVAFWRCVQMCFLSMDVIQ